jgi:predicted AAA+ superfamily ATPase
MPRPVVARYLDVRAILERRSCFLFGPRQTGKSTLIRQQLSGHPTYNLLDQPLFIRLARNPALIREALAEDTTIVVIDEIQKMPELLNEVQLMIDERDIRFLLTGSSARSLRRKGVNLLGGRARSRALHPFVRVELGERFDLTRALEYGLLPSIYLSDSPVEDLAAYAGDYLKEEVAAEAIVRNIGAFSRFLEVAAHSHGQMINFSNLANDAQVPASTVREYYGILKDTLIAHEVPALTDSRKRKGAALFRRRPNQSLRRRRGRIQFDPSTCVVVMRKRRRGPVSDGGTCAVSDRCGYPLVLARFVEGLSTHQSAGCPWRLEDRQSRTACRQALSMSRRRAPHAASPLRRG